MVSYEYKHYNAYLSYRGCPHAYLLDAEALLDDPEATVDFSDAIVSAEFLAVPDD